MLAGVLTDREIQWIEDAFCTLRRCCLPWRAGRGEGTLGAGEPDECTGVSGQPARRLAFYDDKVPELHIGSGAMGQGANAT